MKQYNEDDIVNLFEARKYRTFEKKLERYTYLSGSLQKLYWNFMDSNRGDPYEVSPRFRSQGDEWSDLLEDMRTNHEEEWTKHTKDNGKTHNPTLDDMLA